MKTLGSTALALSIWFIATLATTQSQTYLPFCSMNDTATTTGTPPSMTGGVFIPSLTGDKEYRVLIVWVLFADDTTTTAEWDSLNVLPVWARAMVDSVKGDINDEGNNISSYYRRNSFYRFNLVGNVRLVTLDSSEITYHNYNPRGDHDPNFCRARLTYDALYKLSTNYPTINLNNFDKWKTPAPYVHHDSSDGYVDNVWLLLRNYHPGLGAVDFSKTGAFLEIEGLTPGTYGDLSVQSKSFPTDTAVELSPKLWKHGGISLFGSCMHAPRGMRNTGSPTLEGTLIHEMSHHFFGKGHFGMADDMYSADAFTAYSANSGNCFGNHLGIEKLRLGWIKGPQIVKLSDSAYALTTSLYDINTNDSTRPVLAEVNIAGSGKKTYLEYRGDNNFDTRYVPYNQPSATLTPGLLAYQVTTDDQSLPDIKAKFINADGNWDWAVQQDDTA